MRFKGSVTLFAALTFMLVTQCIFTLLEGARMLELDKVATLNADAGVESVFAEYCVPLWENYHLLACDLANSAGVIDLDAITEHLEEITTSNFAFGERFSGIPRINLLRIGQEKIDYDSYTLLTDYQGRVYEAAVSAYMKQNLPYEAVNKMKDSYNKLKNVEENNGYDSETIGGALNSLENANKEAAAAKNSGGTEINSGEITENTTKNNHVQKMQAENPLEIVEEVQAQGILGMVLPAGTGISSKSIANKELVSVRLREEGKNPKDPSVGIVDKVLFEQYLDEYMSNYAEPISGHTLRYELEYILAGKKTDEENLTNVVEKILATREAANFSYLMTDAAKQAEALAMATAIAGATANPAVVEAVKMGLLTSWAFCESVLELRTLLSGERIPIVKTSDMWTSSLSGIGSLLSGYAKAKSSPTGLNYTDYIGTMIMLQPADKICYRAMDLQELTVQKQPGYENFRMDQAMCGMEIKVWYRHTSMFFNMVSLISECIKPYEICKETSYGYFQN